MPAAVKPEKVNDIAGVVSALNSKVQNVSLNLETGGFDIKDAKNKVLKTIEVKKGYDAAYVINRSFKSEDVKNSGEFLKAIQQTTLKEAGPIETNFAETQDDLINAVARWSSLSPGATKTSLSIEVGRIQRELATIERRLRDTQYNYREVLPITALRRLYIPLSNDDRVTKYEVYKLIQTQNLAAARTVPISE